MADKKVGRPRKEISNIGTPVYVRMRTEPLAELDAYIERQPERITRSEAARRLIAKALEAETLA